MTDGGSPRLGSTEHQARAALPVGVVAAATYALVLILVVLRVGPILRLDRHVVVSAHQAARASHALLLGAQVLVNLGSPVVVGVVVVAVAAIAARRRLWRIAIYVVAVRAASLTLTTSSKLLIHRQRPHFADPIAHGDGFSFPSGHASGAAGTYLSLLLIASAMGLVHTARQRAAAYLAVAVAAAVVAACRVLLGVHFPTDVVGGVAAGAAAACLLSPILRSSPQ